MYGSPHPDGSYVNTTDLWLRGARLTVNTESTAERYVLRFKDGTTWSFNIQGVLTAIADRHGNRIRLERTWDFKLAWISADGDRVIELTKDSQDRITQLRDPLGRTVRYTYNGAGYLETVTDPAGGITRYTYDANNRLQTITDPRNITFLTNEYDSAGRVSRQTQADGGAWQFAYTTAGGLITETRVTDPRGHATTHRFNPASYPTHYADALGQTTTSQRAIGTNQLLSVTDPLGRVTRFTYDGNGNVVSITDPLNNTRTFTYDPTFNQATSITDPLGNLTTFEYDGQGNLIAITDPEQNRKPEAERLKTRMTYNQFGQVLTTADPLGNTSTFEYDDVGNLIAISDPLGHTTQRSYNTVARLIAQTDPLGKTTRFSYDPLNRLSTTTDPLGGTTRFTYDPNGNLLTVTDARRNSITHEYDPMDRLSRRIDPLGKPETFSYDGMGNLTSTTDRKNQITTFVYDALNRRQRAEYADGAITTFQYDAAGRLVETTDSLTGAITQAYDTLGRLTQETTPHGAIQYTYDALGRRTTMTVNGQTPVNYAYDAASRLTQILQAPLNPVALRYDAVGRRTFLTLPNGVSTSYDYDPASRLTRLNYTGPLGLVGDLTYQYDPAGNGLAVGGSFARTLLPEPVSNATYDAANQQLAFGDKSMAFDANGNLLSLTAPTRTTTFAWDARNRLMALSSPGTAANFQYDPLGRRLSKAINAQTTQYLYDGADIVEQRDSTGTTIYLRSLNIDEAFSFTNRDSTYFLISDPLASTIVALDHTGSSVVQYTYDPFGGTVSTNPTFRNPFQYTGRENDVIGFYFYRARYYSPDLARFISEDPIGLAGGRNFYRYVENNPISLSDPTGLFLSGLALRGLAVALRTGATAEEIAVQSRLADAAIGTVTAVAGPLLPSGVLETRIPGTGITVGTALDISTGVGGLQTLSLAGAVANVGGAGATVAAAGVGTAGLVGGLGLLGGGSIGIAINNLVLSNPALFPGGNPVENLFCAAFFACEPPPKGAFGRGR